MSQIIEKLKAVTKGSSQQMGFRSAQATTARAQMLLITSLTSIENASPENIAGADAAVLYVTRPGPVASFLQRVTKAIREMPWGCQITDTGKKQIARLTENGCDFVIFPAESTVFAEENGGKLGKILQIESSLSDSLIRAINDLPVDAVLAVSSGTVDFLNWHHLMSLQRLAAILRKPLLSTVPLDVKPGELRALWDAGVDGVVVAGGESSGNLKRLRQEIEKFTQTARRRSKTEALLPHLTGKAEADVEEEEEEDEE